MSEFNFLNQPLLLQGIYVYFLVICDLFLDVKTNNGVFEIYIKHWIQNRHAFKNAKTNSIINSLVHN